MVVICFCCFCYLPFVLHVVLYVVLYSSPVSLRCSALPFVSFSRSGISGLGGLGGGLAVLEGLVVVRISLICCLQTLSELDGVGGRIYMLTYIEYISRRSTCPGIINFGFSSPPLLKSTWCSETCAVSALSWRNCCQLLSISRWGWKRS